MGTIFHQSVEMDIDRDYLMDVIEYLIDQDQTRIVPWTMSLRDL